ncbi:FIST N-terminal domain-containing protein [Hydrogenimonas thermophila]|uniref:histidine kinase n=1 Tax=Hydrogenimonas thermophila TaxID=223786 RepID=A0A1I5KT09_9BACT|nr:FIST N-terminal domain-containing protein [Hydrogenimonas thermophila]WOE69421.1 FIST N-terminal domain-containing protein [Hydrogenimonas thermophila]WOE71930.1 FIST N-terminal domain-containing protein [Hydrogenimonas thermophila]SFO88078.1 Histidine kinase-, DNA gyrase B-, and HSP90-like ATPase [Hydrogenimonas thermophila]
MKQWSYSFNSEEEFSKFVKDNNLKDKEQILVQVNCGVLKQNIFEHVQKVIKKELPQAIIAGASSVSQLYDGHVTSNKIVFSITHFEKSTLSLFEYTFPSFDECDYSNIVKLLSNSLRDDTKGILLITNAVYFDIEKLISNINKHFAHIPIFGGIASDSDPLFNFTIFSQNKIYFEEGLIAVIFSGESLQVSCNYYFDWEAIGKEYTVTKADGRYLSELDGQPIMDIYSKYFGPMDKDKLLNVSISHPLIRTSSEFGQVARALLELEGEKGLYTGEFEEGEKVQIGFGHYERMIGRYDEIQKTYENIPAEVAWFYICISYNYGYMDILDASASFYKNSDQLYGLITFGEFSQREGKNKFLNFTLTRVVLSESSDSRIEVNSKKPILDKKDELLVTLSTLVASSSHEIMNLNRYLEQEVQKRTKELAELNSSLEKRIELEVKKNREKDKMLYHQSKLASMGEMINNIAHQWRQPLNIIALVMQDLSLKAQIGNISYTEIANAEKKVNETLKYLSDTIDDFRSFVSNGENFSSPGGFEVCKTIKNTIRLISIVLEDKNIDLILKLPEDDKIVKGSSNDLKQILLNLIYNAIDVLREREVENPTIKVEVKYNKYINIIVKDNGGGINPKIIDKIFEPYFTTKYKARGTGLGLYMSKMIVEKRFNGKIKARNTSRGAMFWIELPIMA